MRTPVLFTALLLVPIAAVAQTSDWPRLGQVAPRHASEIGASNWSVGAETMDRDYTVYENWKEYLGPLGIKKARVQSGWAKTEKAPGVYDWSWLDEIVFDMAEQGVEPWLSISYGNPLYADGGGTRLGAAIPKTEEALQAWERYTRGLVARYKNVVDEWEVWNEPNGHNPPALYAELLVRTAEAVRGVQPEAKILAMALAGVDVAYADSVLGILEERGKLGLIDEVTYHPYRRNPDESYGEVEELQRVVNGYAPHITIRQGENGAPSERRRTKALRDYDWTETSQAKWALRRLLGDLGRGIPSSYFAMVDMKYPDEINRKGLLLINDDKTVARPKAAYHAVQHLAAIFDSTLRRLPDYAYEAGTDSSLSVFAYEKAGTGQQVVTVWFDGDVPSDANRPTSVDLTFAGGQFADPVYVDLREGTVLEIPDGRWSRDGSAYTFEGVPVYDAPILIADRSTIPLTPTSTDR